VIKGYPKFLFIILIFNSIGKRYFSISLKYS
jgi:hypothetical protein